MTATAVLDLHGVTTKSAFMDRSAEQLRLPHWFGRNWDALYDCLTDLPDPAQGGLRLVVRGWQGYAAAEPGEWETARRVLADAAAFHDPAGLRFEVVLEEATSDPL
ncbi:barstar family protein [Streptomyces sp. NPDC026673]|uniref:barstar family protein n=1 Tax=Streptomyces sp. NPDC026673 TaxID=3155724 RepID=UPI0033F09AE9